jgi:hypothetical protein
VVYTPDWESLARALERVMATGVIEDEAKTDRCRAVADRKINVRLKVDASASHIGRWVLSGDNISVSPHLTPGDFDWIQSRPRNRWRVGPNGPQHYTHVWWIWQDQPIELIELATADVQHIFGPPKALTKRAATGRERTMAVKTLEDLLVKNKDITSDEAFHQCLEKHPSLSKRGFKEYVWPKGRERAKLPPKAQGGRKPKSPHSTQ